jgi:predicted nucleic acid-binding protein
VIIYADTSALAKLLIEEEDSDAFGTFAATADGVITVSISRVETFAALAAAYRDGRLDDAEFAQAKAEATNLFATLELVTIDAALLDNACSLAETHSLRAYDAIHLSALMTLGREDLTFACWDSALRAAAAVDGYAVFPVDEIGAAKPTDSELIQN